MLLLYRFLRTDQAALVHKMYCVIPVYLFHKTSFVLALLQGCHSQGKISGKIPGQGKVREFCGWPGKFRKDLKSQGKSGNLKINGYGSRKIYLFCLRGERMHFLMR